jgi:hypothetical protein
VGLVSGAVEDRGPGRVLAAIYAIFALAAGARSTVQITTTFGDAPLAYSLSAVAAVVYLLLATTIARPGSRPRQLALASCLVELGGVVLVGAISYASPATFADQTVWSGFGAGYGYVPLVLPLLGLGWLLKSRGDGLVERLEVEGVDRQRLQPTVGSAEQK